MLYKAFCLWRSHRGRVLAAALMLSLALCLAGAMPAMFTNIDEYMLEQDAETYGFFHGIFYEVAPEEAEKLAENLFVDRIGWIRDGGEAEVRGTDRSARVGAMDAEAVILSRLVPTEGRLPAAAGEAALEEGWRDRFDPALQVGDRVTVDLPAGEVSLVITGFVPDYREAWLGYEVGTSADRLPSVLLSEVDAEALCPTRHAMVCVTQFNKQENPETAFKGVASTIGKNAHSYFLNRNVYQNRGYNKIFGLMQRILLILPPVIAVAAAMYFALRPLARRFYDAANRLYALGAPHGYVLRLEAAYFLPIFLGSLLVSQALSQGVFALCRAWSGLPWRPFGGLFVAILVAATGLIVIAVYTKKHILPLSDATYTERRAGKIVVSLDSRAGFAWHFAKRRKYSNRSPVFWASVATALVFVTLLCGFMELDKGNYRLNRQTDAQQIAASIETGKGKYTYRYGKYSIWTGELLDAAAVEALESLPGVVRVQKEYGGQIACLIFPEGYSPYAQQLERTDNIPGSASTEGIEVLPRRQEATQRGYTIWVLGKEEQAALFAQYPDFNPAWFEKGSGVLLCPPLSDAVEEGKVHENDLFSAGDTLRFGMLSFTVPAEEAGDRRDVFAYHEQTVTAAAVLSREVWLDLGETVLDSGVNPGVTLMVSEETAAGLDFANEVRGFTVYMRPDCTAAELYGAKAAADSAVEGLYGAQVRVGRAQSATKQIVRAVVCFAAWTALFGAAALLLACWAQVYQNSMDTYTRTFGRLFYLGMDGRTAFQSLVYEGVLYWKRTITLLLPVMAFGETYYVGNVYEYGFDQLFRMLAEAVLRAARDAGLYTAVCVPLTLIAAAVFGRGLEQRAKRRALAGRR